jgi:hypothetical protein
MNDNERNAIRDSTRRLRSRLTYIMLCSYALRLDLRDVLSIKQEEEFDKMDSVLEEIKTVLNALLKHFEPLPKKAAIPAGDNTEIIGACTDSQDAA